MQYSLANNTKRYCNKLIQPCPPSNPDNNCNEIHTPEGTYKLSHEMFQCTTAAQFNTGTHVSFFCPTNAKTAQQRAPQFNENQFLTPPFTTVESARRSSSRNVSLCHDLSYIEESTVISSSTSDIEESASSRTSSPDSSESGQKQEKIPPILQLPPLPIPESLRHLSRSISDINIDNKLDEVSTPPLQSSLQSKLYASVSDTQLSAMSKAGSDYGVTNKTTTAPLESTTNNSGGGGISSLWGGRRHYRQRSDHSAASSHESSSEQQPHHNSSVNHKKPKNNLNKLKSTFIEYVTHHDQFSKVMGERSPFAGSIFYNVGLNFFWQDEHCKPKEHLSKVSFGKAYITCHDVNQTTSSKDHLDVIMGFSTGDFIWYDANCNRYSRLNKNGIMSKSMVTMVKWIPGSEDLLMASFDDGSMLVLDKNRDDQLFTAPVPQLQNEEHFRITKPHKHSKYNPVAHWHVSQVGITAFAFSPDGKYVATVSKDGLLRTIDYTNERLCDVFVGFFGRLLCVAWSPDGQYILTGGQDDLVTIWSFKENKIIARCQGHRSWVTGVAFDPLHCNEKDFRFASVGEDCKLLLWDFSVNALHKPKQTRRPSNTAIPIALCPVATTEDVVISLKGDNSSTSGFGKRFRKRTSIFGNRDNSSSDLILQPTEAANLPTIHSALDKCQVPFMRPVVKQVVHPDPCVDVVYRDDSIVTTDRRGRVRTWSRP